MGGRSRMRRPARLMRLRRNSQFAKLGSISTFKSVNWMRNEAWPIQVMATSPVLSLGNTGCCERAPAGREPGLEHQFPEKGAGIEMFGRRQFLERPRQLGPWRFASIFFLSHRSSYFSISLAFSPTRIFPRVRLVCISDVPPHGAKRCSSRRRERFSRSAFDRGGGVKWEREKRSQRLGEMWRVHGR